ncbi:MAG: FeoB-associated Cys-rich membrane protein [Bacteroidota bacterium]
MIETIAILLIFSAAVFYIGRNTFKTFFGKSKAGCAKGCGSCGNIDFEKLESEIEKNSLSQ